MNERFEKRALPSGNSMSDISQCHSSGAAATKQIQFQYFPLIQIAMLSVSFPLHIAQGLRACWGWRFMYLYCIVLLLEYRKDRSENHVPRRLYLCVWLIGVQWSRVCYHCLNKRRFFPPSNSNTRVTPSMATHSVRHTGTFFFSSHAFLSKTTQFCGNSKWEQTHNVLLMSIARNMIYRYLLLHHMHGSVQPWPPVSVSVNIVLPKICGKRTSPVLAGCVRWNGWNSVPLSNDTRRKLFKYANTIWTEIVGSYFMTRVQGLVSKDDIQRQ